MENSHANRRRVRRALWTLLFLVIATASMVGPTQAVSGLVAASVAVSETFATLFDDFAVSPGNGGNAKNAKAGEQSAVFATADDSMPSAATDLGELLEVMAASGGYPSSDANTAQSNGTTNGGGAINGGGGINGVNGGGSGATNGGGAKSSGQGAGHVGTPAAGGSPDAQSESDAPAGESAGTQSEGEAESGIASPSSSAGGVPSGRGAPDLNAVLDDVAAGLPSVVSPPDFPSLPDVSNGSGVPDDIAGGLPSVVSPGGPSHQDDTSSNGANVPLTSTDPGSETGDTAESYTSRFESVAIPEPTTMLLLGTGAAGYLVAARRRRRSRR